jgi:hypothetical protein
MQRDDQAMEEGEAGNAVKKRHDSRTLVDAFRVGLPRLQRAAGSIKHLGCLTLGCALCVQIAILRKQLSTFDALPALMALLIGTLLVLDDRSHSYLPLLKPLS